MKRRIVIAALGVVTLLFGFAAAVPAALGAPATVPGAPTGLTATPGDTTVVLAWTAPSSNGGSAIIGYNVYEGTTPGGESTTPVNGGTPVVPTTLTVTGLTNATTYYFTVKAVNTVGTSAVSNEAWAIPAATVPGAPTSVVGTAGDLSATVTWTAPTDPGGSNITSYTVTAADGTAASRGHQTCTWTTGTLTCTLTGLTNGDSYDFTVTATNSLGTSAASTASNVVIPVVTAPLAPTGVVATPGSTSVALSWTAPANGGSAITGYNVYEGTTPGGESTTPVNGTLITGTTTTVTGLTNATTYYFTVKAVNAVGPSPASSEVFAIPSVTTAAPGAPTGVNATAGFGSATVTWTAPASSGGSAISSYKVTAADSTTSHNGGQTCTWATGPLTCTLTGLTDGDSYTFTVTATNSVGTGAASTASNAVTPAISAPLAPTGLTAVPGNHKVVLTWTTPSNGGGDIHGYNLYEAATAGGENYSAPVNGGVLITGTSATVSSLTNGDTYYFTVKAVNSAGSSAASNEAFAIPDETVADAPQDVDATAGPNGSAVVNWTAPLDSGGSIITGYAVTPYIGTTAEASVVFNNTATTETLTGLNPGIAYTFTVAATNASGNGASSAPSNVVNVPQAYTLTALSLSATKVTFGHEQAETFSVTVSPSYAGPVPTGTVSVKKSTTTLCVITLSSGKGSCSLTSEELPARTFSVYANYAGNSSFVLSTSFMTKTNLVVARASSTTTLKLSASKVNFGNEQAEHLSVTVSPQYSGATPTGTVTISGTACLIKLSSGKGSCTLKSKTFSVGSHSLVAHFWGSTAFGGSLSGKSTLSVAK